MMLDQPRPFAVSTDCVETPYRSAIPLMVSPATIVYLPERSGTDSSSAMAGPLAPPSWSSCPGKISVVQPRPFRASTDAVDSPKRPAMRADGVAGDDPVAAGRGLRDLCRRWGRTAHQLPER